MEKGDLHGDHNHNLETLLHWVLSADSVTVTLELLFAPAAMHVLIAAQGGVLMSHVI